MVWRSCVAQVLNCDARRVRHHFDKALRQLRQQRGQSKNRVVLMTTIDKVKMVTNTQAKLGQLLRLEKAFLDSIAPGAPVVKGPGRSDQPKPNVSGVELPEPARTAAAAVATAKRESERKERKRARKVLSRKKKRQRGDGHK